MTVRNEELNSGVAATEEAEDFEALLNASSLGAPHVIAARASVPEEARQQLRDAARAQDSHTRQLASDPVAADEAELDSTRESDVPLYVADFSSVRKTMRMTPLRLVIDAESARAHFADELVLLGSQLAEMTGRMAEAVAQRNRVLVMGACGSGKSETLLNLSATGLPTGAGKTYALLRSGNFGARQLIDQLWDDPHRTRELLPGTATASSWGLAIEHFESCDSSRLVARWRGMVRDATEESALFYHHSFHQLLTSVWPGPNEVTTTALDRDRLAAAHLASTVHGIPPDHFDAGQTALLMWLQELQGRVKTTDTKHLGSSHQSALTNQLLTARDCNRLCRPQAVARLYQVNDLRWEDAAAALASATAPADELLVNLLAGVDTSALLARTHGELPTWNRPAEMLYWRGDVRPRPQSEGAAAVARTLVRRLLLYVLQATAVPVPAPSLQQLEFRRRSRPTFVSSPMPPARRRAGSGTASAPRGKQAEERTPLGARGIEKGRHLRMWREVEDGSVVLHADVHMRLHTDEPGRSPGLRTHLTYRSADAYAVEAVFNPGNREAVWSLSRELLISGLEGRTGEGDLVVWSDDATVPPERRRTFIELRSSEGAALLSASRAQLLSYLEQTRRVVPFGEEHLHFSAALRDVEDKLHDLTHFPGRN